MIEGAQENIILENQLYYFFSSVTVLRYICPAVAAIFGLGMIQPIIFKGLCHYCSYTVGVQLNI